VSRWRRLKSGVKLARLENVLDEPEPVEN
jgi:hypothetical protein